LKKSFVPIVLSYGLFLGWLLSFPYNGPVLKNLVAAHHVSVASYSLTYTIIPAIFLIIYSFFSLPEKYAKSMMVWSLIICCVGTVILFTSPPTLWYPFLALMGIASVVFIIGWSYYYTMEVPIKQKLRVMALVIITGNTIYYLINILHSRIPGVLLLALTLAPLVLSLWAALAAVVQNKIAVELEQEALPGKLLFVLCLFLFILNLTDGMAFHTIQPSFERMFTGYFTYYGVLPYIITLVVVFICSDKLPLLLPVYLGTSLIGLSYLSFGLLAENWYSYFITETCLQIGWALLDLALWTLFGLIASVYGRPLKISGYAFLANLFAVFTGGLLGVFLLQELESGLFILAAFAIAVVFLSFLIVPWLSTVVEKDLRHKLFKSISPSSQSFEHDTLYINLPHQEILSPREKQVAELLVQGYTNKQIAERLHITENTIKTHTKKIYHKLNISNKRELLQLSFSAAPITHYSADIE